MAFAPRDLTITYGSETFGSVSTRQIHERISIQLTPRSFSVEFRLLVSNTTDAFFATDVAAIEDIVRTPFQDLVISFNGQEQYNFRESARRGLNTRGQITKSEDSLGTRLARIYTIRFEGDLPADQTAGQPTSLLGWRESTVQVAFDSANRRTVTISGEWTATPSPSTAIPSRGARDAYEQASSGIAAYASSVLTAIDDSATWRLHDENYDLDEADLDNLSQGSVLRFSRVYREVLFQHAGIAVAAGVQTGAVTRQLLRISRDRTDLGSSPGTRRLLTATANYEAWIDNTVVAGSSSGVNTGGGLENLWDNTIREFILDRIRGSGILGGAIAVVTENPSFEFDENRITAVVVCLGGTGSVLERRLTLEENEIGGITAVPVWDGGLRSRYVFDTPVEHRRTITETSRLRIDINRNIELKTKLGDNLLGGKVIERHSTTTPLVLGTKEGGGTLNVVEVTARLVILVFDRTDGRRLTRGRTLAGASAIPFLFDFSDSAFEFSAGGVGEGFGGQAPIDVGGGGIGGGGGGGQAALGDVLNF